MPIHGSWNGAFHRKDRSERATAYRTKPNSLAAQRRAARLLRAAKRVEDAYERTLHRLMRGFLAHVRAVALERALGPSATRHDASALLPPDVIAKMFVYVRRHVPKAFDAMAGKVNADSREAHALLGITPSSIPALGPALAVARERNVARLQAIAAKHAEEVNALLADPDVDRGDLPELLAERAAVAESAAKFVAHDEVLKTNAAITRTRQEAAGVDRYRWSTSRDERVRPGHKALEGQIFAYAEPPEVNDAGDTANPGEDYNCRCVPLPVIEGLEEELPEAGEEVA